MGGSTGSIPKDASGGANKNGKCACMGNGSDVLPFCAAAAMTAANAGFAACKCGGGGICVT